MSQSTHADDSQVAQKPGTQGNGQTRGRGRARGPRGPRDLSRYDLSEIKTAVLPAPAARKPKEDTWWGKLSMRLQSLASLPAGPTPPEPGEGRPAIDVQGFGKQTVIIRTKKAFPNNNFKILPLEGKDNYRIFKTHDV